MEKIQEFLIDLHPAEQALIANPCRRSHDLCGGGSTDPGITAFGQYRPGHYGYAFGIFGDDDPGCSPGLTFRS